MHKTGEIKALLKKEFGAEAKSDDLEDIRIALIEKINELILTDFQKLVTILYRVDINEVKLEKLLNENPEKDAGIIIAELIIERQLQKIKTREQFGGKDPSIPDDEKW